MFGTNRTLKADLGDGQHLAVQEVFNTVQGEGPEMGTPAVFIRLVGCNLACYFCDTDFETSSWRPSLGELVEEVQAIASPGVKLVVLTGGEPLRQNIVPLLYLLRGADYKVQIETAGTLWPDRLSDIMAAADGSVELICSPKLPKVHPEVARYCFHWKYIVEAGDAAIFDGLPTKSTQKADRHHPPFRPTIYAGSRTTIWVQPQMAYTGTSLAEGAVEIGAVDVARTEENTAHAVKIAQQYGYRVSVQIHKVLGLP